MKWVPSIPGQQATHLLHSLMAKVAGTILLVELAVLLTLGPLRPDVFFLKESLLHASLVTLCCSALVYFWLFRPLEMQLVSTHLELEAAQSRLERLTRVDPLTGVANRRTFFEQFERDWNRASRYDTPLSCIMLDLDQFHQLNDNHGYLAGDAALRRVGQLVRSMCRSSDSVCRYGGEEFCIVLPETSEREAADFADRLRREIARPSETDGSAVPITGSFGVATRDKEMSLPENLIGLASRALSHSKQHGRDRVTRASELEALAATS